MDGHAIAQKRVSNPALSFVRNIALAAEVDGKLNRKLAAQDFFELAVEHGIEVPGHRNNGEDAGYKIIGLQLARVFKEAKTEEVEIEGYIIKRSKQLERRPDGNGFFQKKFYLISRSEPSSCDHSNHSNHSNPTKSL